MNSLPPTLTILSAMITPAVLIAACGTLILSTSNRLSRVVDQVRDLSDRFETLAKDKSHLADSNLSQEKFKMLFDQLGKMTKRARLLQRGLANFYWAITIFVGTSVAIGVVAIWGLHLSWFPIGLAFVGTGFLFYSTESRKPTRLRVERGEILNRPNFCGIGGVAQLRASMIQLGSQSRR